MTKSIGAAALLLAIASGLPGTEKSEPKSVAFKNVTVVDATGGPALAGRTVLVMSGRIAEVGETATIQVPKDAEVIEGAGKFLIPGLWDMHVHTTAPGYFPLYIANGVVGTREMHAFVWSQVVGWRKGIAEGTLLGPRIVTATALVDGPDPFWPGSLIARNEKEGRQAVHTLKSRGADFVKVYSKLPRDAYFAIADEAKKLNMVFAGHVPESVSAAEASDAGQKSIEHLTGIVLACSRDEARLRKEMVEAGTGAANPEYVKLMRRTQVRALDSYSEEKATALMARFARNRTWQVPTLVVLRNYSKLNDPAITSDDRIKYMPAFMRSFWEPKALRAKLTAADFENLQRAYRKDVELLGKMHHAGVPILAGTDVSNPFCFPGFSLHDELALLVQAGLTPMEALQSATRDAAKYLGETDSWGTVEKAKNADLVLLDANPLDDIHNTRKIAAVVLHGKLIKREALQKMLNDSEQAGQNR
jgi:imidazolonepropionase-like amidohydrolase